MECWRSWSLKNGHKIASTESQNSKICSCFSSLMRFCIVGMSEIIEKLLILWKLKEEWIKFYSRIHQRMIRRLKYTKTTQKKNAYHDKFKLMKLCSSYCGDADVVLWVSYVVNCRGRCGLFTMNYFANAAPAKAAARDDYDEESNDNPHNYHPELPQTFETSLGRICHIVYNTNKSFIWKCNNCRRLLLSFYKIQ